MSTPINQTSVLLLFFTASLYLLRSACAAPQYIRPLGGGLLLRPRVCHLLRVTPICRTFDPEEADFFYVPVYITCLIYPVLGWADYPAFHAPTNPRPMHAANLVLDAKRWLQQHMPWWDRRQGHDHIFLMAHDEGG